MDGFGLFPRRDNPSFSSSLLDTIYRSIDGEEEDLVVYKDTMRKKQGNSSVSKGSSCKNGGFLGADKWMMDRKATAESQQVLFRRSSAADVDMKFRIWKSSSSGSSDSSCGVFSSSEAESVYNAPPSGKSCYRPNPKPVRTGKDDLCSSGEIHYPQPAKSKKSRALKIYADLKKVKQPISPGGRLASFLNSLFTARSKVSGEERKAKSANASTCSSASSFSRSCLSKTTTTPSSTARTAGKRSVRFYPVSVIVDEYSRPCGHKNLDRSVKEELTEKNRRVEEAARDLLRNYQKKVEREFDMNVVKNLKVFEDDEDDDADSYASSDLFELDNLSAIGMERYYSEELPVYETTNLGTNRAIANGLIL